MTVRNGAVLSERMMRGCPKLENVNNLENAASFGGINIFKECTSLVTVNLPPNVTLYDSTFEGCTSLANVNNLSQADAFSGSAIFKDCTSLVTVNLPSGVALGDTMFEGCTRLQNVNGLSSASGFNGKYTFFGCTSLQSVTLPVGATLSAGMFAYCSALQTVTNVETAAGFANDTAGTPYGTFDTCTSLTSITLPNVTYPVYMFYQSGLVTVNLPVGATLSARMFRSCASLTTVNNLDKAINLSASSIFNGCSNLVSVSLPAGATLGASLFRDCIRLTTVNGFSDIGSFGGTYVFGGCTALESVTLPAGKALPANTFDGCARLDSIGDIFSVGSFGTNALRGCALDFTVTTGYPAALTSNLSTLASGQRPKVYFTRTGVNEASIHAGTAFTPPYTLQTKLGTDYAQMVTDKTTHSSWLNQSATAPVVSTSGFDVNTPGVYTISQTIPGGFYANAQSLPAFTLTVQGAPTLSAIAAPAKITEQTAPILSVPSVNSNYAAVTAQGWEIKKTTDPDFSPYTQGTALDLSYNGANLRYFATNEVGTAYSNAVVLQVVVDHSLIEGTTSIGQPNTGAQWRFMGEVGDVTGVLLRQAGAADRVLSLQQGSAGKTIRDGSTQVGTVTQGSAVIALNETYVDKLPNGSYTLVVTFTDGGVQSQSTASFTINRGSSSSSSSDSGSGSSSSSGSGSGSSPSQSGAPSSVATSPQTGDTSGLAQWWLLVTVGVLGLLVAWVLHRKLKQKNTPS